VGETYQGWEHCVSREGAGWQASLQSMEAKATAMEGTHPCEEIPAQECHSEWQVWRKIGKSSNKDNWMVKCRNRYERLTCLVPPVQRKNEYGRVVRDGSALRGHPRDSQVDVEL